MKVLVCPGLKSNQASLPEHRAAWRLHTSCTGRDIAAQRCQAWTDRVCVASKSWSDKTHTTHWLERSTSGDACLPGRTSIWLLRAWYPSLCHGINLNTSSKGFCLQQVICYPPTASTSHNSQCDWKGSGCPTMQARHFRSASMTFHIKHLKLSRWKIRLTGVWQVDRGLWEIPRVGDAWWGIISCISIQLLCKLVGLRSIWNGSEMKCSLCVFPLQPVPKPISVSPTRSAAASNKKTGKNRCRAHCYFFIMDDKWSWHVVPHLGVFQCITDIEWHSVVLFHFFQTFWQLLKFQIKSSFL